MGIIGKDRGFCRCRESPFKVRRMRGSIPNLEYGISQSNPSTSDRRSFCLTPSASNQLPNQFSKPRALPAAPPPVPNV
ncbi:hypothetical protein BC936DRAFT_148854 [Jimgerdemannia flammicorona]|uniref:Uncharacterized protein n=1 Tax=Jimgerdemannia flammicorona TaxID=994334 RepID=A0A433D261_9FUNG|nr:hypothetical protein BC936DRAFT_148854 [Jimgerdemannia flammicorona]